MFAFGKLKNHAILGIVWFVRGLGRKDMRAEQRNGETDGKALKEHADKKSHQEKKYNEQEQFDGNGFGQKRSYTFHIRCPCVRKKPNGFLLFEL